MCHGIIYFSPFTRGCFKNIMQFVFFLGLLSFIRGMLAVSLLGGRLVGGKAGFVTIIILLFFQE